MVIVFLFDITYQYHMYCLDLTLAYVKKLLLFSYKNKINCVKYKHIETSYGHNLETVDCGMIEK